MNFQGTELVPKTALKKMVPILISLLQHHLTFYFYFLNNKSMTQILKFLWKYNKDSQNF